MTEYKSRFPFFILFVPAAIALIAYGYLGSFSRFLADDFCSAYYAKKLGLLRSVWYWYLNWSGRYTAFGIDWVMEKLGAYAMPAIPPFALLFWLIFTTIAFYLFLRRILPKARSKPAALALAAIFLFVVLMLSPNIPQSLYWWNGMRSYSLPLILLTLYSIWFQIGTEKLITKKAVMAGGMVSFLFAFINGGLGETYIAFQLVLFAFLLGLEWLVHRDTTSSRFVFLLSGLVGSAFSIIVVITSPGNGARQGYFPSHPSLVTLFQISLKGYLDFILDIVTTPEKITGLIGAFLATLWLGGQCEIKSTENRWVAIVIFAGAFVLSFACFVPGVYVTSEPPPTRTFTIPIFILVACLFYTGFFLGQQFVQKVHTIPLFIGAMLLIVYSGWINTQHLYNSRKEYVTFAYLWDQTDALILKAKANNMASIQIPAMDNWAGLERPIDNPKYWPNKCYSAYYGIQVFGPPYP